MIEKLQHQELDVSKQIRAIFQASYTVEATLLKASDFPPLKRPLDLFVESDTSFFGYKKKKNLIGVIEISQHINQTHINSLVVAPMFFRNGVASALIQFIIDRYHSNLLTVETGVLNTPAISLYQKFHFKEVNQWETSHGVRKVKFERSTQNRAL